jgi:hypothetical protein
MDQELKEKLKARISDYVKIDKEIKILNDELKKRNETKKNLTQQLVNMMENTNIDCLESGNNAIIHKKRKSRQCISRKYLKSVFDEYINDSVYTEGLLDAIMEKRHVKVVDTIVCKDI